MTGKTAIVFYNTCYSWTEPLYLW